MTQNKRPPVGSTGTLAELMVEAGDVVEYCGCDKYEVAEGGKLIHPDGEAKKYPYWDSGKFTLISRANPDQPPHIITHNGRKYDLTALETPPFLLPTVVYDVLAGWDHGWIMLDCGSWIDEFVPPRNSCRVYRAKPAPKETRVQCYRGEIGDFEKRGTCIKCPDGSIDWTTWEPE